MLAEFFFIRALRYNRDGNEDEAIRYFLRASESPDSDELRNEWENLVEMRGYLQEK